MAKPDETADKREPEAQWGTWEELLLACAVHRYGTKCWDSVAVEIQKRSSTSTLHHLLTPHHCKQKYHDLKRRYTYQNDAVPATDHDDDDKPDCVPWLDELRKLRVAELKRELERYDLSIVSLQLKVKRLKEEREESLREGENGGEKSDLEKSVQREREEAEKREERGELEKSSPESVAGEESDRENQSVGESNSTDPKGENHKTEEDNKVPEPVPTGDEEPDRVALAGDLTKPVGEDSCNGSSDSIAKKPVLESENAEPEGGGSDSPELWESVAESKDGGGGGDGEEGTTKESSDVQSSASKSRKGGGSDKVRSGCISGDEPENEDQSPAIEQICVKSQPFVDFLDIVRSHKLGSVFERRFESQETLEYKNLIRQHMDLETIRMRVEEGSYSGCNSKFFRDLLLLFNNAILFFGKKSRESAAAIELRKLISKEMPQRSLKSDLSAGEQTSSPPVPISSKPEPEPSDSLLLKPKISGPMIVCRKRSSIAAKASGSSSGADRKREQKPALLEEKPILDWKQPNKSSSNAEEPRVTKKRTQDRFASGSRNSKKNSKTRSSGNPNKNSEALSSQNQGKVASSGKHSDSKSENNTTVAAAKKRSAANFLNRMQQSSSTNNGSLLDTLKNSTIRSNNNRGGGGGGGGGGAEQKRSGNGRVDGKKEQASRRGSGGRQVKEQGSPAKRTVGRPPKRAAAPPHTLPAVSGKRSREGGDTEAAASRQPKKRSRK